MTRCIALVSLVLVMTSCAPNVSVSTPSPPSVPTTAPAASPSASAAPSPTTGTLPFPDLPFVVGTESGDVYTQLSNGRPSGPKLHVCDGAVIDLVAYERQVLAACDVGNESVWYLWDRPSRSVRLVATVARGLRTAALTGTGGIVYVDVGRYESSAPIPMTRLVLRDLASGSVTQIDERYGVANALRLTGEGVAVWRAKKNPAFIRSDAEAGTWILRGTTLVKFSQHQLIAAHRGVSVLETEPQDIGSDRGSIVYVKTTQEQRLTPVGVSTERVVALLEDGRILTWRPGATEYAGDLVIYERGVETRVDHGIFSSWRVMRSGDWAVAGKAAPDPALLAYRISGGLFASVPVTPGAFRSIALVPGN